MKLIQVDEMPSEGLFVVTGISGLCPFGISLMIEDSVIYEYNDNTDDWDDEISMYFLDWADLKYFVISKE